MNFLEMFQVEVDELSGREVKKLLETLAEIAQHSFKNQRVGDGNMYKGRAAVKKLRHLLDGMEKPLWFREKFLNMGRNLLKEDFSRSSKKQDVP